MITLRYITPLSTRINIKAVTPQSRTLTLKWNGFAPPNPVLWHFGAEEKWVGCDFSYKYAGWDDSFWGSVLMAVSQRFPTLHVPTGHVLTSSHAPWAFGSRVFLFIPAPWHVCPPSCTPLSICCLCSHTPSLESTDVINWLGLMQHRLSFQALWDRLGTARHGGAAHGSHNRALSVACSARGLSPLGRQCSDSLLFRFCFHLLKSLTAPQL